MAASLRAVARPSLSFSPTHPKLPSVRSLHITGSNAQPSTSLAFQNRVAELRKTERTTPKPSSRPFNTTRALQKPGDSSPMDLTHFPSLSFETPVFEIGLIPLLPDTASGARASHPILMSTEAVIKPEISTSSQLPDGIISPLGESEGGKSADSLGLIVEMAKEEAHAATRVWNGFVDDLLGPKKSFA